MITLTSNMMPIHVQVILSSESFEFFLVAVVCHFEIPNDVVMKLLYNILVLMYLLKIKNRISPKFPETKVKKIGLSICW